MEIIFNVDKNLEVFEDKESLIIGTADEAGNFVSLIIEKKKKKAKEWIKCFKKDLNKFKN